MHITILTRSKKPGINKSMVGLSVTQFYEKCGESLSDCKINHIHEDEGNYFNLANSAGGIVCMDGEICSIISHEDGVYTLVNEEGDSPMLSFYPMKNMLLERIDRLDKKQSLDCFFHIQRIWRFISIILKIKNEVKNAEAYISKNRVRNVVSNQEGNVEM